MRLEQPKMSGKSSGSATEVDRLTLLGTRRPEAGADGHGMMQPRDGTRDETLAPRGRPRIYATVAERQAAYRQRLARGASGPSDAVTDRELRARLQRLEALLAAVLERLGEPERQRVALIDRLCPPTGGADGGPRPAA
jgi:hypothetical protein